MSPACSSSSWYKHLPGIPILVLSRALACDSSQLFPTSSSLVHFLFTSLPSCTPFLLLPPSSDLVLFAFPHLCFSTPSCWEWPTTSDSSLCLGSPFPSLSFYVDQKSCGSEACTWNQNQQCLAQCGLVLSLALLLQPALLRPSLGRGVRKQRTLCLGVDCWDLCPFHAYLDFVRWRCCIDVLYW